MTIQEAADRLGLSPITLRVQIRNGKLRATKRGRDWWVTPAAVDRYRRDSRRERLLAELLPNVIGQTKDRDTAERWAEEEEPDGRVVQDGRWYVVRGPGHPWEPRATSPSTDGRRLAAWEQTPRDKRPCTFCGKAKRDAVHR